MANQIEKKKLPNGWVEMTLGEIRIDHSENIEPAKYPNNRFELYSVPSFDTQSPEHIAGSEIGSSKRTTVPNTVLLCKINPRINRVWLVGKSNQHPQITSTEWIPFFPLQGVFPKYLLYFLQNPQFRSFAAMNVSGVGGSLMRIKPNTISRYPFFLPPLAEQHRIVAKIEELFSDLDAGIASLKQTQAQLKTYRQAVLKYAFEGKLTAAWRQQHQPEAAERLLAQIKAEREKQYQQQLAEWQKASTENKSKKKPPKPQKPKEFPPLTEAELAELPELPEGWRWVKLGEHAFVTKLAGFEFTKYVNYKKDEGIPVIRAQNVSKEEFAPGNFIYVDRQTLELLPRSRVYGGEVLMVFVGAGLGNVGIVPYDREYFLGPNVAKIKLECWLNSKFVKYFLSSKLGFSNVTVFSKATAQGSISMGNIREVVIPLSTLEEQHQIVQEIESRLSVCDKLEESLKESLQKAEALRQSILKKAFAGKLVPQDPNDAPAERLLERIKAAKS